MVKHTRGPSRLWLRWLTGIKHSASITAPRAVVRLFKRIARFRSAFENGKRVDSVIRIAQGFSEEVDLVPEELALAPANITTFHGCPMLANVLEPPDRSPRIAKVR